MQDWFSGSVSPVGPRISLSFCSTILRNFALSLGCFSCNHDGCCSSRHHMSTKHYLAADKAHFFLYISFFFCTSLFISEKSSHQPSAIFSSDTIDQGRIMCPSIRDAEKQIFSIFCGSRWILAAKRQGWVGSQQ